MGGWITGRGNDEMTMLNGYAHLREFFERMQVVGTRTTTRSRLRRRRPLSGQHRGAVVRRIMSFICPRAEAPGVSLAGGNYAPRLFDPRTGQTRDFAPATAGPGNEFWNTPATPDDQDWVWHVVRTG